MIIAATITCISLIVFAICYVIGLSDLNNSKSRNNVHFYVARDKDKTLWLFLGKPIRDFGCFISNVNGCIICNGLEFENFGLNKDDYKDLKWGDDPVEVFLNMEKL